MIMNFITGIIEKFLDFVIDMLKKLFGKIDLTIFTEKFDYLIEMVDCLNIMFPIKEILTVLGILCSFAFISLVFWCVQKLYHMIRG